MNKEESQQLPESNTETNAGRHDEIIAAPRTMEPKSIIISPRGIDLPVRETGTTLKPSTFRSQTYKNDVIVAHDPRLSKFPESERRGSDANPHPMSPVAKKKWKKVGLLLQGIVRMNSGPGEDVRSIDSLDALESELSMMRMQPTKPGAGGGGGGEGTPRGTDAFKETLTAFRRVELFCECAANGSDKDIRTMEYLLQNHPTNYLLDTKDPNHFINQRNKQGSNALYLAAKNGSSSAVTFLLSHNANPNVESSIAENITEIPLEVAVRWNHQGVIDQLLKSSNPSREQLERALKKADNKLSADKIKRLLATKTRSFFSFCGCH